MATAGTVASIPSPAYLWWFPGSPVKVHLALSVVQRLNQRLSVTNTLYAEEGLLFGGMRKGTTEIVDFQSATSMKVPDMIGELAPDRKQSLIGYYRAERGEALRLTPQDLVLAKQCFAKPNAIFLIIHLHQFGPPTATFFFNDQECRMADFAFLEFPFDPLLLASEQQDRRDRSQQSFEESASPAPEPVPAVALPQTAVVTAEPAAAPKQIRKGGSFKRYLALTCFAALVFTSAVLMKSGSVGEHYSPILRAIWGAPAHTESSGAAGQPAPRHSMSLHAIRRNGDLELSWDRDSAIIAGATSGTLSIEDGETRRLLALNAAQLRAASLLYSPRSDQISMELTVVTPGGTVTESVMVILPSNGQPRTYPIATPKAPLAASDSTASGRGALPGTQPKPFTPPVAKAASAQPFPVLQDPPAITASRSSLPALPIVVPKPSVPAPPTPVEVAPKEAVSAPVRITVYEPPVALVKSQPVFPAVLRNVIVKSVTVEVKVSIDKTGKVTHAETLPQKNLSAYFVNSAVSAALTWKFKPAQNNHQPVESESILQFVFNR